MDLKRIDATNINPTRLKDLITRGLDLTRPTETYRDGIGFDLVAKNPDPDIIHVLVDAGLDADTCDDLGFTLLMYAARYNIAEVVRALIEAGADVNKVSDEHFTALMEACTAKGKMSPREEKKRLKVVSTLIDAGAVQC